MLGEYKSELIKIFGERVAFHDAERLLYSRDMVSLPAFVRDKINTIPDCVVQPVSVDELSELVRLASKHLFALVPRGAGTAGYGGAVPTCGGVVVDFSRMNCIIDVDVDGRTVVVEPGVVWEDLEDELGKNGLSLMLYPSSAISSMVGGWIANGGGVGIGSFGCGTLRERLVEVEILTASGDLRTLSGDDLDLVFGMNGTTGFITKIRLEVTDSREIVPVAAAYESLEDLTASIERIREQDIDLWHISFKDSQHIKWGVAAEELQRERMPLHHEEEDGLKAPEGVQIAMYVYRADRRDEIEPELLDVIESCNGRLLDETFAAQEWDDRFNHLRLKALGPSLVSSEIVLQVEKIPEFRSEVLHRIGCEAAFEGVIFDGGRWATVLIHTLEDERRRGSMLSFAKSLTPLQIGEDMGGHPYTAGMLLNMDADLSIGKEKLERAYAFKTSVDPRGIMNPGKVFPERLDPDSPTKSLSTYIKLARKATGLMKALDETYGGRAPGREFKPHGIIGRETFGREMVYDAYACISCGYCRSRCTEFKTIGWESASPRGKFNFIREYINNRAVLDERIGDIFFTCTTCENCNLVCQAKIPIEQWWDLAMRPVLKDEGSYDFSALFKPSYDNLLEHHNAAGNPHELRTAWVPDDARFSHEGEVAYFAGCIASYTVQNLAENAVRLLNHAGIEPVYLGEDEWCCGAPMGLVGRFEDISEVIRHNIEEFNKRGVKTLITSCPGCWVTLAHYYPLLAEMLEIPFDIKVEHITQVLARLIREGRITPEKEVKKRITYHDPCHIARAGGIYDEPREVLESIPGIELVEMPANREHANCDGRHTIRFPEIGKKIAIDRVREAEGTGADLLVSTCSSCETNLRIAIREIASKLKVVDVSDLLAESIGLPVRDSKEIERLVYNAYDSKQKPKLEEEAYRAENMMAPHQKSYFK
ncbi:heterodisulfide reductase subunit D [Candidatus Methanoperedenaceae archaeon GB37]|nr:heterodisulfide reductase subunit D [Candidatus Methanoperedenaceae archaeon GB37]